MNWDIIHNSIFQQCREETFSLMQMLVRPKRRKQMVNLSVSYLIPILRRCIQYNLLEMSFVIDKEDMKSLDK